MKTTSILLAALTGAVVLGCNKNVSIPEPGDNSIVFTTGNIPEFIVQTKASVVSSLSAFNASAVTGSAGSETAVWTNAAFSDGDSDSKFTGDKYWPLTNDNPYRFYASNAALTHSAAGNTVTVDTGTDVVCAYLDSPTYKDVNTLTFDHVFARIGNMTVSAESGYTITGVSIRITPKVSGTYNLRTGSGQTDGTGWSATSDGSAVELANATPGTKENNVFLVPGRYTLTASWTATRGQYTETFTDKTQDVDIVGGSVNSITTTLGGLAKDVQFSVGVNTWGSNGIVAEFPLVDPANGHEYVDLGLRVGGNKILFATMNIGASAPEEYGDYFAWGETSKRYTSISGDSVVGGSFIWSNCPYHTGSAPSTGFTKYIPADRESFSETGVADNKLTLEAGDDVASVLWGGNWRMPDRSDLEYLISDNVTYIWTNDYNSTGVNGYLITGKSSFSSASLFLPTAGNCSDTGLYNTGDRGNYWSRSVRSGSAKDSPYDAFSLDFNGSYQFIGVHSRYWGLSVRPVLVIPE